jgi:antitoxin (DNA-binding transcriptional repressor) of toxin-antitoxin stability system
MTHSSGREEGVSVTISELESRLGYYLHRARAGETLILREGDTVIARIEPAGSKPLGNEANWLEDLERRGIVRPARTALDADWLAGRPEAEADIVEALIEDRRLDR